MEVLNADRSPRRPWAVYAAVLAFMVFGANYYSVFDDEALSCRLYSMPMGDMVRALWHGEDPDPPLYYVLQNAWVHVFGVGPFALRSLSIIFFLLGLVVMRRAGAAWFGGRAGRMTLLLCAMHPAHLFFGFAGRWYSAMFLMVALLLLMTGRFFHAMRDTVADEAGDAVRDRRPAIAFGRRSVLLWGIVAAAVCYTNYFGPVVVGLAWLVMLVMTIRIRRAGVGRVIGCGIVAVVAYAPWVPTLWHHVRSFPRFEGGLSSMLASAGRLGLTLTSGNLAGLSAWWVWGPMGLGVVLVAAAMIPAWRRVWPVAVIVIGAIAAGTISRTLLDKYALTVSGGVCLLVAGVVCDAKPSRRNREEESGETNADTLSESRPSVVSPTDVGLHRRAADQRQERGRAHRWLGRLAMVAFAIGWLGCMVNLVTQRHWSSLRWLDPFKTVTRNLYEANWSRSSPDAVCSHPAARYYFALLRVTDLNRNPIEKQMLPDWAPPGDGDSYGWLDVLRVDAGEWRAAWEDQESAEAGEACFAKTPEAALSLINSDLPPTLMTTLETSGYVELPDWAALRKALARKYRRVGPPKAFLRDAEAALKDRIDPAFRHAQWRITVETWRLKTAGRESAND